MSSRSRIIKDIHTPSTLSPSSLSSSSLSPNNSKNRKRKLTSKPSSLSPNSKSRKRKLDTPPKTTSLSPNKIKKLEPYINESFDFLRDTSILKTGHVRDKRKTKVADVIKDINKKLLLKYPELNNNVKFAAMIKGTNTRTFGGKGKKTYKNNNTKKRRTVKRKST